MTRGEYRYDFGDTAGLTPLMKMYTLGHDFVPSPIHAGGLRYHGMAPLVSHTVHEGLIEATEQVEANDEVGRYVVSLAAATRRHPDVRLGVSTRGALGLIRVARARAAIHGRSYVTAEDIRRLIEPAWSHRLLLTSKAERSQVSASSVIERVIAESRTPDISAAYATR